MSLVKRLRRINISLMLRLVSFIFLIPIVYLLIYSILGYNGYIEFAEKEKAGAEVLIKIKPLLYDISKAKISEMKIEDHQIRTDFEDLITSFENHRADLGLTEEKMKTSNKSSIAPENIYTEWKNLNSQNVVESDYDKIIHSLISLNNLIGDVSNLILDPDLDSYYLMDVALLAMPQTTIRMFENQYNIQQNIDPLNINFTDRINLSVFNSSLKQSDIDRINGSINTTLEQDEVFYGKSKSLLPNIKPEFDNYNNIAGNLLSETQKANSTDSPLNISNIFDDTNKLINASSDLWDNTLNELIILLNIRIESYKTGRLSTILIALFSVLIAYIAQILVTKNITNLIAGVISFSSHLAKGEIEKAKSIVQYLEDKYF